MKCHYENTGVKMLLTTKTTLLPLICVALLTGCMQSTATSKSGTLLNDNIRELDVIKLAGNKFQVFIRGNGFSSQTELREQFKREASAYCGSSSYSIIDLKAGDTKHDGYTKPTLEGTFTC